MRMEVTHSVLFYNVLLVSTVGVLAGAISVNDCPPGIKSPAGFGTKCYRFELQKLESFQGAQESCEKNGGSLALLNSKNVNDFIKSTSMAYDKSTRFWIGLRYRTNSKKFYWIDGKQLSGYRNFSTQSFTKSGDCVAFISGLGQWTKGDCKQKSPYICEYRAFSNVQDCPAKLHRDKYLKAFGKNCYRFEMNSEKTFQDAQEFCQQSGGNLALVKTNEVNNFIRFELEAFRLFTSHVWIGLRYSSVDGKFNWVDKTELVYKHFHSKMVSDSNECVAMVASTGWWGVYRCKSKWFFQNEKNHFVCQYPKSEIKTTPTLRYVDHKS